MIRLVVICLLLCSYQLYGQEPVFTHYTVKEGLPSSEVYSVIQDSRGFIWISTDRGICRFDGTSFKTYTTEDGLADNTIFDMMEDDKHRLWFHSFSGRLSYFADDKIYSIKNNQYFEKILSGEFINHLYVHGDYIWIGVINIIYQFKINKDQSCSLLRKINDCNILDITDPSEKERHIEGIASRSTDHESLIKMHLNDSNITLDVKQLHDASRHDFKCLPFTGNTWLSSESNVIFQFDKKGVLQSHSFKKPIIRLYKDSEGAVWVSFHKGGVKRFKPDLLFKEKEEYSYLDHYSVTDCLVDKEGGAWFSTLEDGIYFLPSKAFYYYPYFNKFEDQKIAFVGGRPSKDIFAGMRNGKLFRLDNGDFKLFNDKKTGTKIKARTGQTMLYTSNGALWFSFFNEMFILDSLNKIIHTSNFFITLTEGENGSVWGYENKKLYEIKNGKTVHVFNLPINVRKILYREGKIWLAALNGLWRFNKGELEYTGKKNILLRQRANDLGTDKKNRLWIATLGSGILVKDKDSLFQIGVKEGLVSNMCNTLFIDKEQNVWVGTNSGLSRIRNFNSGSQYSIENYTINNGLISNEINQIFRQHNKIWIATRNGLSMIDLKYLTPRSDHIPIYITGININSRDTNLRDGYRLSSYKNNITLSYVGISFINGGKTLYRYLLKSSEHNETRFQYTTKNNLQFSTLPPGDYLFSVWAKEPNDKWSIVPATIHFTILHPFWTTWWFRSLIVLMLIVLLFIFFYWRFRQLLKKNRLEHKLNELKQQAMSARMNPHFMFNALNSIQNYISSNKADAALRYLAKFARLMRLILSNSKSTFIPLHSEIEALKLYTDIEVMRYENHISCLIHTDPELQKKNYKIPTMIIQPHVENAIKHGLAPKKGQGKLEITFSKEDQKLVCSISDNGIGRKRSAEYNRIKQRELGHESMGTTLIESRVELLHSLYKREIRVEIKDKYDLEGHPAGTVVNIYFPLMEDEII